MPKSRNNQDIFASAIGCYLAPLMLRKGFDGFARQDLRTQSHVFWKGATVIVVSDDRLEHRMRFDVVALNIPASQATIISELGNATYRWLPIEQLVSPESAAALRRNVDRDNVKSVENIIGDFASILLHECSDILDGDVTRVTSRINELG